MSYNITQMRKEIRPAEDCWQWPHAITCFKDLVISSFPPHTPSQMDTSKLESFVLTTIPQFTIVAIYHTWTFCLFFFFSNISFCIGVEKAMAPHSSTLAWRIPWTEEPGRLQSTGSLRVGHDWATSLSLFIFLHWRRKWQPTPVLLPGQSQVRGNLEGCHLWGRTESDTTEAT